MNHPDQHIELAVIIILSSIIIALTALIIFFTNRLSNSLILRKKSNENIIFIQRISAALVFTFFPLIGIWLLSDSSITEWGILFLKPKETFLWIFTVGLFVVIGNIFRANSQANLRIYPQIRVKNWNFRLIILSALTWLFYLLSYEFFFRGFMLFTSYHVSGIYVATAINVLFYTIAHIPKGKFETMGAVPLGILLCLITYHTGSFWAAFAIHSIMALSNEWMSVFHYTKRDIYKVQ